jgi:hypothetical protein
MSPIELPKISVAEHLAQKICALDAARLPEAVRAKCEDLLVDVVGLAVTARNEDYVKAALAGCDDDGQCTAIGHGRTLSGVAAALVNGTAIHGEDFDDTFEGGPIHAGAVIVPAVLAACERHNLDGRAALLGIAVGVETMCRLSTVAPTLTHKAGFHPTAVFGAMGATAGVGAALKLKPRQLVDALGTAASMASGIIEYLAEGAWTKRLHAGWAAQSGIRAALLGRAGFTGPRTVFEGVHGFFHGFAHTTKGDYDALIGDFGTRWVTETLAFKPYPCGTMTHPYIDCARRLAARKIKPDDVVEMVCEVGEKILHAVLHRHGIRARQCGLERLFRCGRARSCRRRACRQGALPDRSAKSLSKKFHRPHPRHLARRHSDRGAPALYARRCAGAADAGRHPGQVFAQRDARRLDRRPRRASVAAHRHVVRRTGGAYGAARLGSSKKRLEETPWPP